MLGVMIAEDNSLFREELVKEVANQGCFEILFVAEKGEDLLDAFNKKPVEVIFLDIGLPDMSGIEVARKIRESNINSEIIFVTSYQGFTKEAIEFYALDYLVKPLDKERLYKSLDIIKKKYGKKEQFIAFDYEGKTVYVKVNDVVFVEALRNRTKIYAVNGEYLAALSLKEISLMLPKDYFCQTSRSYVVSISKVESVKKVSRDSYYIFFRGTKEQAVLTEKYYKCFRETYKKFFKR